jgi:predicted naringenin-chalcone synthase
MGCYAAFPALRMAQAFCAEDERAVVLVVCLELCTLHLEPSEEIDDIIAASVFADGAAAAVVTARPPGERDASTLQIESLLSTVAPESEDDMAWTLGDRGFDMVLSTSVPQILQDNARSIVDALLGRVPLTLDQVDHWAIHPGGRAILDKVQAGLELADDALEESRTVLRNFGNMSSATILFVLERFLAPGRVAPGERVYAMAFGPGLTVESGLFVRA